jgi:hypothetical protein
MARGKSSDLPSELVLINQFSKEINQILKPLFTYSIYEGLCYFYPSFELLEIEDDDLEEIEETGESEDGDERLGIISDGIKKRSYNEMLSIVSAIKFEIKNKWNKHRLTVNGAELFNILKHEAIFRKDPKLAKRVTIDKFTEDSIVVSIFKDAEKSKKTLSYSFDEDHYDHHRWKFELLRETISWYDCQEFKLSASNIERLFSKERKIMFVGKDKETGKPVIKFRDTMKDSGIQFVFFKDTFLKVDKKKLQSAVVKVYTKDDDNETAYIEFIFDHKDFCVTEIFRVAIL